MAGGCGGGADGEGLDFISKISVVGGFGDKIFIKLLGALFRVLVVLVILVVGVFASWVYCLGAFTLRASCMQLRYVMSVISKKKIYAIVRHTLQFTIYVLTWCSGLGFGSVQAFLKRTYNCFGVNERASV